MQYPPLSHEHAQKKLQERLQLSCHPPPCPLLPPPPPAPTHVIYDENVKKSTPCWVVGSIRDMVVTVLRFEKDAGVVVAT